MGNSIHIYHHLGMGDSILCNGLVRHFAELYNKVFIFAKPQYFNNVLRMYHDNPNIKIIQFDDAGARSFIQINSNNNYLILGHTADYFNRLDKLKEFTFEEGFYKIANVPFEYKWSKFFLERDYIKEAKAFEIAGIKEDDEYIFVHDDPKRGRIFKTEYIDNSLKSIHPSELQSINLFDFLSIIQRAKEVHVHNSSFANLIDIMRLKCNKVFYHKYARSDCGDQTFDKSLNWTFYN